MASELINAYEYFRKERELTSVISQPNPDAPLPIGRNDPCPCGAGKKYKKCCGAAIVN